MRAHLFRWLWVGVLAVGAGCSKLPPDFDGGSGGGGAGGGGGGLAAWSYFELDQPNPMAKDFTYLGIAVDPAQEKVGVAYFKQVDAFNGTLGPDGGLEMNVRATDGGNSQNFEIRYVEYKAGVVSAPQTIRTVQRVHGISVAFQPSGEPAMTYLGGGSDMSAYWFQSDTVITYRTGGTAWTEQVLVTTSPEVPCGSPLDVGFLSGTHPTMVFDGPKAYIGWRDGHNGAFPQQDWAGSDLKLSEGIPGGAFTHRCIASSGNTKQAYGGHAQITMANGQPAIVHDRPFGGADTIGRDVTFHRRNSDGSWTNPALPPSWTLSPLLSIGNTQTGASIAYDPPDAGGDGYGIAALERSQDKLYYVRSANGDNWDTASNIFGGVSGGWYPSLAMDPVFHEPAIAFYICSPRAGQAEGTCQANEDELMVIQRVGTNWQEKVVDKEGGRLIKLGFFASGKRVVVYRLVANGNLRLAVER